MLKKIRIEDNGDSEFLPGTLVDFLEYEEVNEKLEAEGLRPAIGKQGMLGITKAFWQLIPSCQLLPSRRPPRF